MNKAKEIISKILEGETLTLEEKQIIKNDVANLTLNDTKELKTEAFSLLANESFKAIENNNLSLAEKKACQKLCLS